MGADPTTTALLDPFSVGLPDPSLLTVAGPPAGISHNIWTLTCDTSADITSGTALTDTRAVLMSVYGYSLGGTQYSPPVLTIQVDDLGSNASNADVIGAVADALNAGGVTYSNLAIQGSNSAGFTTQIGGLPGLQPPAIAQPIISGLDLAALAPQPPVQPPGAGVVLPPGLGGPTGTQGGTGSTGGLFGGFDLWNTISNFISNLINQLKNALGAAGNIGMWLLIAIAAIVVLLLVFGGGGGSTVVVQERK